MSKCNVELITLLLQGLSEPDFYGDFCIVIENRTEVKIDVAAVFN